MTDVDAPEAGSQPVFNQELKNPHLVETAVFFPPLQGARIVEHTPGPGSTQVDALKQQFRDMSLGNIPTIDCTFRIQGVPLILTDQSYLVLNLLPWCPSGILLEFMGDSREMNFPPNMHFMKANWPKLASCCVKSAKATFSNFGVQSDWPFFFNYINALGQNVSTAKNNKMSHFFTYVERGTADGLMAGSVAYSAANQGVSYFGRDRNVGPLRLFQDKTLLSPYKGIRTADPYTMSFNIQRATTTSNVVVKMSSNTLQLHIPLREILPIFSVPVIPLLSTNAAQIELTITLYDPRYMFPLSPVSDTHQQKPTDRLE